MFVKSIGSPASQSEDLNFRLKWLMFARVLFTTLLLGSTAIVQLGETPSPLAPPLLVLYGLITGIFILSFFYSVMLTRVQEVLWLAYLQISIDSIIVSLIIFVTGNFSSIFSFLYLVVIIYSSILLYRKGSMVIALLCSVQYALLVVLEYKGWIVPFAVEEGLAALHSPVSQILYKILITTLACLAVAFLSSFLAEQTRRTRKELWAMEDQVKRVEKMAVIGEMAAGLAHEIKNPLASLTGSIQILKDGIPLDTDHARLMQIVLREADRLSSLVNNFLLFARPPAGKSEIIDLSRAIAETVELFEKDDACRAKITIQKKIAAGILIQMDPIHFRQVLWNLLLNAAEAIDGSGRIEINLFSTKGRRACMEISDTGCGISEEVIGSIFDPFFTTKNSGTGLGLSIVHSILESYDSRLEVRSRQGTGTTFAVHLKRTDPPTQP
jgi:two-component system sensor histidine kinase PilS (NtrC family)